MRNIQYFQSPTGDKNYNLNRILRTIKKKTHTKHYKIPSSTITIDDLRQNWS